MAGIFEGSPEIDGVIIRFIMMAMMTMMMLMMTMKMPVVVLIVSLNDMVMARMKMTT